jgi:hypothetical protein
VIIYYQAVSFSPTKVIRVCMYVYIHTYIYYIVYVYKHIIHALIHACTVFARRIIFDAEPHMSVFIYMDYGMSN